MTNLRDECPNVFREMLPGVVPDNMPNQKVGFGSGFAPELMEIGIEGIFGRLWNREGSARRERSLVTLGILIGLGAEMELESHFRTDRQIGLTDIELAELVYHASGYTAFPAANTAAAAALKAPREDHEL